MKTFLNNNFLQLIILLLIAFLLLERCNGKNTADTQPSITIVRDTTFIVKDSTIIMQPQFIKTLPVKLQSIDTVYLPSPDYERLKEQYLTMLQQNIYSDSFKVDSSTFRITDTVFANRIIGRSFSSSLKYPVITNTITINNPPKRALYVGFGVEGTSANLIDQFSIRGLYKDRRNRIYGASAGIDITGQKVYGFHTYWPLKF